MTTPVGSEPVTTHPGTPTYESLLTSVVDPDGHEVLDPATGEVVGRVAQIDRSGPGCRGRRSPGRTAGLRRPHRQAVASANKLDVGLGASVWSSDRDAARAVAARLEAGTVWINSHGGVHPMIPFGGVMKSGYGLEFGVEGPRPSPCPR